MKLFTQNKPDIITLTDTYIKNSTDQDIYPLDNYELKHENSISTYTKKGMNITHMEDATIKNAATIIIQIHKNKHKNNPIHTIINIYRRPHRNEITDFIESLQNTIHNINKKHPKTTITIQGDLNINLLQLKTRFYHFLIENNLHTT